MPGQLSYSYQTPQGVAGGLLDIAPYSIDSRLNGETDENSMMFGMAAVQGPNSGLDVVNQQIHQRLICLRDLS